ncbi:MAG: hypothetical protein ACQKBY_04400 [Verrucomicrobiales bacterium]
MKSSEQRQKEADALDEFSEAMEEMKDQQAREFEEKGYVNMNPEGVDALVRAAEKMESTATGDEAEAARLSGNFMKMIQADVQGIAEAQKTLEEAMDYSGVKKVEDLNGLGDKVRTYRKLNEELRKKIESEWLSDLRKNVAASSLSKKSQADFLAGAEGSMKRQKPYLLTIRETDDQFCEALLLQQQVLRESFGKWEFNAETSEIVFADDEATEGYNKQAEMIQQIAEEQAQAQRALIQSR